MKQAVNCDIFLYADDSCLAYQHNEISKIGPNLSKNFLNILDWLVENKLSIHFGQYKTKYMLFGAKQKLNKTGSLGIVYGIIQIKQYHTATYLGCALHENLSGKTMTFKVNWKTNCRLRLLNRSK